MKEEVLICSRAARDCTGSGSIQLDIIMNKIC